MDLEEFLPKKSDDPLAQLLKEDLDPLSVEELDARVAALHHEIKRCETRKKAATLHRSAADDLFKKS